MVKTSLGMLFLNFFFNNALAIDSLVFGGVDVLPQDPIARSTVFITGKIQRASFTCSGVLIERDIVITAGHCLGGGGYADLIVHFGVKAKEKPITSISVIKQVRKQEPPINEGADRDDIAVLRLAKPAPNEFEPAKVLADFSQLQNGTDVLLAGYGRNTPVDPEGNNPGVGVLRKVNQKILDIQYAEREILIDIRERGVCTGDSGGPAFLETENGLALFGITSHLTERDRLPDQGRRKIYGCIADIAYTNVLKHLDWIEEAIVSLR